MIPRYLHLIWIQSRDALPPSDLQNVKALERLNPDWICTIWDDQSITKLLEVEFPDWLPLYQDPSRYWLFFIAGSLVNV